MNELSPAQLMSKLLTNQRQIELIGAQRTQARNELILAEAILMDAEADHYKNFKDAVPVTRLPLAIKHATLVERKAVQDRKKFFQEINDAWEVLIEVNNSLKAYIRLREVEIRDLQNS